MRSRRGSTSSASSGSTRRCDGWRRTTSRSPTLPRWKISCSRRPPTSFGRRGGWAGWAAFPFALFFECLSPLVEALGWAYFGGGYIAGWVGLDFALAFLAVNIGFGTLLSVSSLLLDEMAHHTYPRLRQIFALLLAASVENLGYRQLTAYWRLVGMVEWLAGTKAHWGDMKRTADWSQLASQQISTPNRP